METIKVRIERTYKFVSGGGCDGCDLSELCNEVNWNDYSESTAGHYEIDDEQLNKNMFDYRGLIDKVLLLKYLKVCMRYD